MLVLVKGAAVIWSSPLQYVGYEAAIILAVRDTHSDNLAVKETAPLVEQTSIAKPTSLFDIELTIQYLRPVFQNLRDRIELMLGLIDHFSVRAGRQ